MSQSSTPKLIGISGLQGAGKDTCMALWLRYVVDDIKQWRVVDTSRMIIGMYANANGIDFADVKKSKYDLREELQAYGDKNRQNILKNIRNATDAWLANGYNCILNSVRTNGEYMIVKELDQYFFLIEADSKTRKKRVPKISGTKHHTEGGIIPVIMDEGKHFRVNNNGSQKETLERLKSIAFYMNSY